MSEDKSVQRMSAEAAKKFAENVLVQWESPAAIRKVFAPNLTDDEFKFFMGNGIVLGASPFAREIFAIKFGDEPAQVVVARALYRRKAQEQSNYGGSIIEVVYPGEKFQPNPFDPEKTVHEVNYEARYAQDSNAMPYGAYFIGFYTDGRKPLYHFVATKEYIQWVKNKKTGETYMHRNWREKPETMIKKVADSQGHRLMYQGIFKGTLTEDEIDTGTKPEDADFEVSEEEESVGSVTDALEEKIMNRGDEDARQMAQAAAAKAEDDKKRAEAPEPEPEPAAEEEPGTTEEEPENTEQDDLFDKNGDAHDWPGWQGVKREDVLRKFRYVRNEAWPKAEAKMKEQNVFNLMQFAMKFFDEDDFQPHSITESQYQESLDILKKAY